MAIRIRVFSNFCDSNHCKNVYTRLCETTTNIFTTNDDYTHVIIINTAMPDIHHISPKNVIGLAFEPPAFLHITPKFIEYAIKHIGKYFIGSVDRLPAPFIEHFAYMWHNPPRYLKMNKTNIMSIVVSRRTDAPGHIFRHRLISRILQTTLPIDIYGNGCGLYSTTDLRIKGEFVEHEPYDSYQFHICIENYQINHYFSEKIINALLVETTPIYCGAHKIDEYFPNSVITLPVDINSAMILLTQICADPFQYKTNINVNNVKKTINLLENIDKLY